MTIEIACTNSVPDLLTDDDCAKLCAALSMHLAQAFCPAWNMDVPKVTFYPTRAMVPSSAWEIALVRTPPASDQGDLAYHDDPAGHPDGFVFVETILSGGGGKLTDVGDAFGHEALEALRNPHCNLVLQGPWVAPDGTQHMFRWAEVCDPVQGHPVPYDVDGTMVWMPAFVLPAHEDELAAGPYSYPEGIVTSPGAICSGGYSGYVNDAGNVVQVFGEHVPDWQRELKSNHGRIVR